MIKALFGLLRSLCELVFTVGFIWELCIFINNPQPSVKEMFTLGLWALLISADTIKLAIEAAPQTVLIEVSSGIEISCAVKPKGGN